MPIHTTCPGCQAAYDLPDRFGGKKVRCRQCRHEFDVPAPPAAVAPAEILGADDEPAARAGRTGATEGEIQSQPRRVPPRREEGAATEAPRKDRRRRDDEDEDRPRRRTLAPAGRRQAEGFPTGLVLGIAAGVLLLLACGGCGLALVLWPARYGPPADKMPEAVVEFDADRPVEVPPDGWRNDRPPGFPMFNPDLFPPEARDRDDGHAPAPVNIPPPARADVRPPALDKDRAEVALPAPVADVAAGGAGRYLILHLPQQRKLAVFDANEARVVKYLPAAADNVKFAAGMDKLVVVRPDNGAVERWSLTTFEREATATLRMDVPAIAVAMGSASNGPLVVSGVDFPRLGETAFFDVLAMKRIDMSFHPHGFFDTSPNVFLRASADGRTFACVPDGAGGNTQACTWSQGRLRKYAGGTGGFPVPGPDGRTLYTADGLFTWELRRAAGAGTHCLPAHHGPYYLTLPRADGFPGPAAAKGTVAVHLEGDGRAFATLAGVEVPAGQDKPLPDRRVHLIPDAKLLVTIPAGNDRLVLRRFDPEQALEKSGLDYLAVTSRAPTAAKRGAEYSYQIAVKSKKGGVKYRVASGPPGAAVGAAGKVTWAVPADFADGAAEVAVAVSDAGGREVTHAFRLDVGD